jgi:pimeloyl-ACP methyl ester carboxylesterase
MRLILQHGWGFSETCWRGWLKLISSPCILGNRGYWGAPKPVDTPFPESGFVLVCHSLGLHFLSHELLSSAALLVVIGGFAHFHGNDAAAGRFTRRHIQRMLSRIESDPAGLLRDFYRDCACPDWPTDERRMDTALLTRDLILLDQSRLSEDHCQGLPPALLIHGREDRIVRPERAEELAALIKGSQTTIIDNAGHGLPFTHPGLCLDLIRDAYRTLT